MSPVRRTKARIGEILLQKGLITLEQLQEALAVQRKQGQDKRLGQILVELGHVDKEELCIALAIQCGYPYLDIGRCAIDSEVAAIIPKETVERLQILPIDRIGDILTLAMVNPLDKTAIEEIEKTSKSRVRVFFTTSLELKEMIARLYTKA